MSALTTKRNARVVLKIATNIQGKNPVGVTAANTNPVTIGGVNGDNDIVGLVLNADGSITAKLAAGTAIIGKFIPVDADGDEKFTDANPGKVTATLTGSRDAGVLHRSAIATVDKVPTVTITAADSATDGSLTAVAHGIGVAPGNLYGSAGVSALVTVTPTVNKSIDVTIPQATGAEYYDIFLSTSTTSPLWVARVTESQRAAGCAITAVGTVGLGGSAGVVNVQVVGTGISSVSAVFSQNNAYTPSSITEIDCTGKLKAIINLKLVVADLRSAPAVNIIPFYKNQVSGDWHQGQLLSLSPLAGLGQSLYQTFELDVSAVEGLVLLISLISGQNASVSIWVDLL